MAVWREHFGGSLPYFFCVTLCLLTSITRKISNFDDDCSRKYLIPHNTKEKRRIVSLFSTCIAECYCVEAVEDKEGEERDRDACLVSQYFVLLYSVIL